MQFWLQPITGRAVSCTNFRRPMRFSDSLQPGLVLVDGVLYTGDLICMPFWLQLITGRAVSCTIFRRPMRFSDSLEPGLVLVDGVLPGLDLYTVLASANHRPCCILYDFPPTNEVLCFSTAWTRADGRCPLPGT